MYKLRHLDSVEGSFSFSGDFSINIFLLTPIVSPPVPCVGGLGYCLTSLSVAEGADLGRGDYSTSMSWWRY